MFYLLTKMLLPHELKLVLLLLHLRKCLCELQGNVVGGISTDIEYFPHSATVTSSCINHEGPQNHLCGASIVNHRVLLTAAHCLDDCSKAAVDIIVSVGHTNLHNGDKYIASTFYMHINYNPENYTNDIGLVGVQNLKLSEKVARVSIMRHPPYREAAYVAGWGYISEKPKKKSPNLKKLLQSVMSYNECKTQVKDLPKGTLCGGKIPSKSHTSVGDSGDALVVKDYIQIGIVSHKDKYKTGSLAIYTDVGYHYDWIILHAKMVYCSALKARNLKIKELS